jgi:hypothetical protein
VTAERRISRVLGRDPSLLAFLSAALVFFAAQVMKWHMLFEHGVKGAGNLVGRRRDGLLGAQPPAPPAVEGATSTVWTAADRLGRQTESLPGAIVCFEPVVAGQGLDEVRRTALDARLAQRRQRCGSRSPATIARMLAMPVTPVMSFDYTMPDPNQSQGRVVSHQ